MQDARWEIVLSVFHYQLLSASAFRSVDQLLSASASWDARVQHRYQQYRLVSLLETMAYVFAPMVISAAAGHLVRLQSLYSHLQGS